MRHYISNNKLGQICILDLVEAAVDSMVTTVEQLPEGENRRKAAVLASRLLMHKSRARHMVDPVDLDKWESKDLDRYRRSIGRLQDCVRTSWPGATVDAVEFLAAILEQVAKVDEQLPRTHTYMNMRIEWGTVHTLLQLFYEMFDPEGVCSSEIDRGEKLGEQMRDAIQSRPVTVQVCA